MSSLEYANSVQGLIERIAFEIGDAAEGDEYTAFPEAWIRARVYDTFKWLRSRRPSLFSEFKTVTLTEGDTQQVPDDCDQLLEPLYLTVDCQEYPVKVTDRSLIVAAQGYRRFNKCASTFRLYHVAQDNTDQRRYYIEPTIAPGSEAELKANFSCMKSYFENPQKEIACEVQTYFNTVAEYVKFLAMSVDGDNARSAALSEQHRETFFNFAPIQRPS